MENETKNINIPIKSIVEQSVLRNGCKYSFDDIVMLRRYFISCLNLGFLKPEDLVLVTDKFCSKIKFIVLNYNSVNKMDYYLIDQGVLYISGILKQNNEKFFDINFFKAITEVIFNANDNHIGFSNAITNMTAEKIYNFDVNESRIVIPSLSFEMQGDFKIKLRAGYLNYNLIISLVKQLFISMDLNENIVIKEMFFDGYEKVLNKYFNSNNSSLLLEVLDNITNMYILRNVNKVSNKKEKLLTDKFQILINESFNELTQGYFAFLALVTTDELREKFLEKYKNE